MNAELLVTFAGGAVLSLAVAAGRERRLREKDVLAWAGVGLALLLGGLPPAAAGVAAACHLSATTAALLPALAALFLLCFGVSLSLTRQCRRNLQLTQEVALLEYRLHILEASFGTLPRRAVWGHPQSGEATLVSGRGMFQPGAPPRAGVLSPVSRGP
jgi:hypothetical protein